MLTDRAGRVARFSLQPGNTYEAHSLGELLDSAPSRVGILLADKAYDSRDVRSRLADDNTTAVIPPRSNSRTPTPCDMATYQARHLIENTFADLKQFRGIATRYCKLAATYTALVCLTATVINTNPTRRGASPHL